ncbi:MULTISPECIES: CHAT domain-containing protein [Saccharothrix]|uniref:CHAT domain-containing protein n=1 Tax=Saccharothrix TaxID=2071 RepID=UPI0009389999|nr:CHAT domain-containing protein [Saccharothrix sp. CB00851]OKI29025.1 hypothetical protein A6A25_30175 [Saccharothrix sp. CB00851]
MRNGLIRVYGTEGDSTFQVEFALQEGAEWRTLALESSTLPSTLDDYPDLGDPVGDSVVDMIVAHVDGKAESAGFGAVGRFLHDLVFKEKISRQWLDAVTAEGGLRTYLLIEQPELRSLPWELMCDRDDIDLARVDRAPILRVDRLPDGDWTEVEDLPLPIRILVVVGQEDEDERIGAVTEVRAIKEGLAKARGRFEPQFLIAPRWQEVKLAYQRLRPHVLHFIGHATTHDGEPELLLHPAGSDTRDDGITARDIRELRPAPRLAILNACRPASSREHRSLAEAFLESNLRGPGALAVIGMQGDIRGQAAALFTRSLYRDLARHVPLDIAVTRARDEVHTHAGGRSGHHDWFLPALTVRRAVERVLSAPLPVPKHEVTALEGRLHSNIVQFVDRDEERLRVTDRIVGFLTDEPTKVLLIQGESRVGKSLLVDWTRRWCALRGHRVKYVDLKGRRTLGLIDTLDAIAGKSDDIESIAPGADAGLARFTDRLSRFGESSQSRHPGSPETLRGLFDALIDAMRQSAEDAPLVLILDHVENVVGGVLHGILRPMLIERALDGALPDVRLVLVMDTGHAGYAQLRRGVDRADSVDVRRFAADDFVALVEDAVHKLELPFDSHLEQVAAGLIGWIGRVPWLPEQLIHATDTLRWYNARRTS